MARLKQTVISCTNKKSEGREINNFKIQDMFLDDELLEMCKNVRTADQIADLYSDVMKKCEGYYKSKMDTWTTHKEARSILNKTFNLFDSFVRNAKKHPDKSVQILGKMFERYSFKRAFLDNPERKKIYESL